MSLGMFVLIIVLLVIFVACYVAHRKRLAKEFEEKVRSFIEVCDSFFVEFDGLFKHYIQDAERDAFILKYKVLYHELQRYSGISSKVEDFVKLEDFKKQYKDFPGLVFASNAEIKRKECLKSLIQYVNVFLDELSFLTSRYVTEADGEIFRQKWEKLSQDVATCNLKANDEEYGKINLFKIIYKDFSNYLEKANETFFAQESQKYDYLFSNIDGKSLDMQQREAVVTDEDRILVLAGAGSGKTLTIAGKVKYLCDVKNVSPEEILLISFTKKSAQEMTDRIQGKLGIPVKSTTFHKLGLDIIKSAVGKRPDVLDESLFNEFIHNFFEKELVNYPELVKNLIEYFAYYIDIPKNMEDYSSLGEMYEAEKSVDLETLRSKYDQEKYIQEEKIKKSQNHTTLKNEKVKSLEEVQIANFLFLNGVNYEYEKLYPFENSDPLRKAYRPDFYLKDYDIYLEHFGITRNNTVPWLSPVEAKKYLDGIDWKRELHKQNNTKLIETYSYYNSEGVLLQKLEEILKQNGVVLKSRDFMDIFNTVYATKTNKYFSEFVKLCGTFIVLFKSNNYTIETIDNWKDWLSSEDNKFLQRRNNTFLNIIRVILEEYQKYLIANNSIDFSDMINNATENVNAGCDIPLYKYVIVDEYQDISKARFNLLKAIVDKTKAKLFCVGDDWQSIYRFAGSDISLFTDIAKYFGKTKILKIEKTYRNSQKLIDEASRFILQNPLQLKKSLRSDKKLDYPLVFWGFDDNPKNALQAIINKIALDYGANSSILLLGRTNYDIEIAKDTGLFRKIRKNGVDALEYVQNPKLQIQFLSVHKSKGLEADNVILLNFRNDKLGFPNQIIDDPVLNFVLTNAEDYRFAEERRLFYVAITRTKNRTYVLVDNKNPSLFFKEFSESTSVFFKSTRRKISEKQTKCPLCKTGDLLKVEHDGKTFVGCSNFPRCRYAQRDVTILSSPKICPECGGFLVKRKAYNGYNFVGCSNYPACGYKEKMFWK
ncbi:UvrD-helicase domain-containing protein [Fibrobacter sp. UWB2]|uniref:UvrD-helicase domain-containing protein n=1 Tax=Fibrobacter sp. UWB2 TaxID=1964358 RepID=UPI001302FAFE|nr:UvrD-helicase domain-containing protein [Fibrobacter sp. UWB2]